VLVELNATAEFGITSKYSGTFGGILMLADCAVAETAPPPKAIQPCTSEQTRIWNVWGPKVVDGTELRSKASQKQVTLTAGVHLGLDRGESRL